MVALVMADGSPGDEGRLVVSNAESESAAGIMLVESEGLVRNTPKLLGGLNEADRRRVRDIGREVVFEADQPVWRQGDVHEGIYLINSGRVRTFYLAPSGREVTLAYWFPDNFVGGPDILGGGTHMWCSSATQRTSATFLPGPALRKLTLEHAPIAVAMLDALAFKARCYSAMAQMMGTRSATERLERLLAFLATVYGMKGDDGIMIAASFTHAELASLIGSTRQWVTTQFARLQDRDILRYNRGLIVVRDLPALGLSGLK
ncbi:Crp/Fnr family transcriptional regulator [Bradyrhizobium sp. dw_78]|uniref:Crp/Fnr family transcriptional regulator n=1 Tax=Bradyrhizobium sp. dw_78 TaxID=2719793 RepID=UPI00201C7B65|nr:Crp/Fnr family transcriptional regulator [Bradyrhizobium sp. dw_78]